MLKNFTLGYPVGINRKQNGGFRGNFITLKYAKQNSDEIPKQTSTHMLKSYL